MKKRGGKLRGRDAVFRRGGRQNSATEGGPKKKYRRAGTEGEGQTKGKDFLKRS